MWSTVVCSQILKQGKMSPDELSIPHFAMLWLHLPQWRILFKQRKKDRNSGFKWKERIYIRSDLLDLSEAFLRVSLKSQRLPYLTVLKIPQSHPDICQASVSPQCENLQPRASRGPSSLGLCADFLLCVWVLCFIRALLFVVAGFFPLSSKKMS